MNTDYLVSIIIPIFNTEKYLRRCIDSVLIQSFSNLEIILVNDGSTDNSSSICKEYALIDNRIILIHQSNQGLSNARNKGLSLAKGEYVTFVDSDDFISSDFIFSLLKLCVENSSEIAQCDFQTGRSDHFKNSLRRERIDKYEKHEALRSKIVNSTIVCGKLFLKRLFEGIEFPEGRIYEDEFTTYKLIYASSIVSVTNRKLYYYFQSQNSIMRNNTKKLRLDFIDAYNERVEFFRERNEPLLYESAIRRFCIVLIAFYSKCKKLRVNQNDLPLIMGLFRQHYRQVLTFKSTPLNDHVILRAFKWSPDITASLISIIKR